MENTVAVLKELLKSKKFAVALITVVAVLVAKLGYHIDEQEILTVLSPILAYITGQGIADIGKEKAKIEQAGKDQ